MRRLRSNQTGMSLLELLAATFIFAIAAGGMFKIIGENSRHTAQLELRYFAQLAANNALIELHLQKSWPPLGSHQQQSSQGGREFEVTRKVEATDNKFIRKVSLSAGLEDQPDLVELHAFVGPE